MNRILRIITRFEGVVSAVVLMLTATGSIAYDGNTILVSAIGIGLWVWLEVDERKSLRK